jgi:hypothetical protein
MEPNTIAKGSVFPTIPAIVPPIAAILDKIAKGTIAQSENVEVFK